MQVMEEDKMTCELETKLKEENSIELIVDET